MAYLPHCQVIIKGVLGVSTAAPSEIWQTGHQISDTNTAGLPSQGQVDQICQEWGNCFGDSAMNISADAIMTGIEVVAIAPDGKWRTNPDGSYMKRSSNSDQPTAGAAAVHREYPVSSVVSLMTNRPGAHGRGRMYWPVPAETPAADGTVPQGACTNRADRVGAAFGGIHTILSSGAYQGVVVVASRAGFLTPVTALRVGNVHDTQRRRRNSLPETYSVHVL